MYAEYAEKECTCDGTWYQKPPKVSSKGNVYKSTTSSGISSRKGIIHFDPKTMPVVVKRRGAEWTNYKTCR